MDNKTTGTVKFFNTEKGFGFIKHDDSSKETFVHASGLIDEIKEIKKGQPFGCPCIGKYRF
jgi:CspA family cold shock protein